MQVLGQVPFGDGDPAFDVFAIADGEFARVVTEGLQRRPQPGLPPDHPAAQLEFYTYLHAGEARRLGPVMRIVGTLAQAVHSLRTPVSGLDTMQLPLDEGVTLYFALLDLGARATDSPSVAFLNVIPLTPNDYLRARDGGLEAYWASLPPMSGKDRGEAAWRNVFEHMLRP
ncbi:MAG: hypothetical protein JRH11_19770 [Deltaproteobacteria bacterium]|nr:hypothetical protein [Deltaproteobacteria bacterium]